MQVEARLTKRHLKICLEAFMEKHPNLDPPQVLGYLNYEILRLEGQKRFRKKYNSSRERFNPVELRKFKKMKKLLSDLLEIGKLAKEPENYLDQNEKGCRDFEEFDFYESLPNRPFVGIFEEKELEIASRDSSEGQKDFILENIQAQNRVRRSVLKDAFVLEKGLSSKDIGDSQFQASDIRPEL